METADEEMAEIHCGDVCSVGDEEIKEFVVGHFGGKLSDPPFDGSGEHEAFLVTPCAVGFRHG